MEGQEQESAAPAVELHGLLQVWYAAPEASSHGFRVRRAELKLTGTVVERLRWSVQVDPSKTGSLRTVRGASGLEDVTLSGGSILQDAVVSYAFGAWSVEAGQFKIPLSRVGTRSSSALELIERPLFASAPSKIADLRDVGARVGGRVGRSVGLQLAVLNGLGESVNREDPDRHKALVGRAVADVPFLPGLAVGASAGWSAAAGGARRTRGGADVVYTASGFTVRSEVLTGADGEARRLGYYGLVAYRFLPRLEAAVRFDAWDVEPADDPAMAPPSERDLAAGLSYRLRGDRAKIQLNYLQRTFPGNLRPSRGMLLLNVQAAW